MAYISLEAPGYRRPIPRDFVRKDHQRHLKHLLSTRTIRTDDVDRLCRTAEQFEQGDLPLLEKKAVKTVALLFFQPSTRTRIGFAAATVSLGHNVIGFEDMSASRSNDRTGESLEDCGAVVSQLCDAIVVRHHEVGAAKRMATTSRMPVINAGDGWNEHPTQALIDVFALRRGLGTIRGTSIGFGGDPRGRTVRSLIQLLRYEAPREIVFCPPPHYEVPADLITAIAEHQIRHRIVADISDALIDCDAIMMAPYDMSDIAEPASSGYVSPRTTPQTHVITPKKIQQTKSQALIYHPMPRHDEIHPSCDGLPNAMYFEQVRLSKYMRMAVLDWMLVES